MIGRTRAHRAQRRGSRRLSRADRHGRGREAGSLPGLENRDRLLRGEVARVAEDIAPFGQTLGGDARNHLVDHARDVGAALRTVLARNIVRAEECRDDVDRMASIELRELHAAAPAPTPSSVRSRSSPHTSSVPAASISSRRGRVASASSAPTPRASRRPSCTMPPPVGGDLFVGRAQQTPAQLVLRGRRQRRRACADRRSRARPCTRAHRGVSHRRAGPDAAPASDAGPT